MNIGYFTMRMARNATAIEEFVKHMDPGQSSWRPAPDKWSILDVICHLYDEERFDFRVRLECVLEDPNKEFPKFNTLDWVTEHRYRDQDIVEMRALFCREREKSIAWLNSLDNIDWDVAHEHPKLGRMSAGTLLGSWLAHDYLHLRQMAGLQYHYLEQLVAPHPLDYAGGW